MHVITDIAIWLTGVAAVDSGEVFAMTGLPTGGLPTTSGARLCKLRRWLK
jgi:hypothetical protein